MSPHMWWSIVRADEFCAEHGHDLPTCRFLRGGSSQPGDLLSMDILTQGLVCKSQGSCKTELCWGTAQRLRQLISLKSEVTQATSPWVQKEAFTLCHLAFKYGFVFSFRYCFFVLSFFFFSRNEGGYMVKILVKGKVQKPLVSKKWEAS